MARHPVDLLSLAFGLLFGAASLLLLIGGIDAVSWEWIGPVAAIAAGGILILAARPKGPAADGSLVGATNSPVGERPPVGQDSGSA
jgi:hypothetical protein